jgi:LuxR family maltose regulon positive regulatory protein
VEWAETCGLKPEDEFQYAQEFEYMTLACVLTAQNKAEQAVPILDRLITSAEGAGRNGQLITYLSLQAVAHYTHGDTEAALSRLSRALALGEPQGYIRTFVDLGPPMRDLLRAAARQKMAPAYVSSLLAAFPHLEPTPISTTPVIPKVESVEVLIEPLNEREMRILRLLSARLSYQEIAEELYLSLNTIKWYARNIYSKLGVNKKSQASARAQELGIL